MEQENPSSKPSPEGRRHYNIGGKEYSFKDKYSLKDWAKILKIIGNLNLQDNFASIVSLLDGDNLIMLLWNIFGEPFEGEVYEEDFEEVSNAINDFFGRKDSLMRNIKAGSPNSTSKPNLPQDNSSTSPTSV